MGDKMSAARSRREPTSILLIDACPDGCEVNEPLGIEVLAGALTSQLGNAVDVRLLSTQLDDWSDRLRQLCRPPQILGLSLKIGATRLGSSIVQSILSAYRESPPLVVLGGPPASCVADALLEELPSAICVSGEGEDALVGIAEILHGTDITDARDLRRLLVTRRVPNLVLRIEDRVVETQRAVTDLTSSASPRREFLAGTLAMNGLPRIEGSRGCPWSECLFCAVGMKYDHQKWRPFRVGKVLSELEALSRRGAEMVYFTDEDFIGADPRRVISLCKKILQSRASGAISPSMAFFISTSVRSLLNASLTDSVRHHMLAVLRSAGFTEIFVGIESGCNEQLERLGKGTTRDDNLRVLSELRRYGFYIDIGSIMFDPEMSLQDLQANLRFIEEAGLANHDARLVKHLRVIPGTHLAKHLQSCGLCEGYDEDAMVYRYAYRDSLVGKIALVAREWERIVLPVANVMQAEMRGAPAWSPKRAALRQALAGLRSVDLYLVRELARMAERGTSTLEHWNEPWERSVGLLNAYVGRILSDIPDLAGEGFQETLHVQCAVGRSAAAQI